MAQTQGLRIRGAFTGYHGDAIFRLSNGQVWQQRRYKYKYRYAYRPVVQLHAENGHTLLMVEGMDEPIEVVRVSVIEEGPIVSDFSGFNSQVRFEFQNGHVWEQSEYKYAYHYAYRPDALIVNGTRGTVLHVDGMTDTVQVRRVS